MSNFLTICLIFFFGLFTYSCNTTEPDPIVENPRDEAPTWSPDGRFIAYHHYNPDADDTTYPTGLYILDLETGTKEQLIAGPAFNPDWGPDGEWIVFDSGDIFKIRPDGSDLIQITNHGSAFFPRWSPDGNTLSYNRSGSQEVVGIWFFHLQDSSYTQFGFGASPADWSTNGQQIVYEGTKGDSNGGNQIWKADTSASNKIQLTANDFATNRSPSWSPNGEWITWEVSYKGHEFGVWLMNANGHGQHKLIKQEGVAPSWSPDSEKIVFSKPSNKEDKMVLWIINRDGSELTQITN